MKFGINNPAWLQEAGNRMNVDWGTQFRLTSLEDDNVITFPTGTRYGDNKEFVEYSFNNSKWNALPNDGLVLKKEQTVAFRLIDNKQIFEDKKLLDASKKINISGELLLSVSYDGRHSGEGNIYSSIFMGLPVVDATGLEPISLIYLPTDSAKNAFADCIYLERISKIKNITGNSSFNGMFINCQRLQSISIETNRDNPNILSSMLNGCIALNRININWESISSVGTLTWPESFSENGVMTTSRTDVTKESLGLPNGWSLEVL